MAAICLSTKSDILSLFIIYIYIYIYRAWSVFKYNDYVLFAFVSCHSMEGKCLIQMVMSS